MAEDKRISELNPIDVVTPGCLFPVVDEVSGETKFARFDQMASTVDLTAYSLKTYTDAQDLATLNSAKDYLDDKINVANGVAGLDSLGKLSISVLPDLAVVDYLGSVASQAAMLGLTGQKGDWCIRTDTGTTFVITGSSPSLIGSWTELAYPAAAVVNVVGTINRITVSGGTTKTIDISSSYIGQSSITTVGALTSGSLGSGFTPVADAQIASANTWNAKLNTSGGTLTGALNYPAFSTLASASTTNIGGVNNNYIEITGTTNITSFGTASAGVVRILRFTDVLTISHAFPVLLLPNSINVTTKANDIIEFTSLGGGSWICTSITQGSLGNYVDFASTQTITGQKTFSLNGGNSQTGTGTGTIITQLDCSRIINAGKYIFYVSGDSISIGKNAGHGSGSFNLAFGSGAGNWAMSGQYNVLNGYFAGNVLTSGAQNTIIGAQAGQSITTGIYNLYSGYGAGYGAGGANSNNVYIGALAGDNKSESFRLRIHSATSFGTIPIIYGEFDNRVLRFDVNSLSIGSTNANTNCSLDLQATNKGLGLNLVNTNLSTSRNGLIWYHSAENVYKGIQNASVVTFATTANTNLTVQFGWKNTYSANTALYQMLNDTGSTKWIAVDACSIYALTLNFGTAPTANYQVFYNKNGAGWTSFNTTDTAANTADVSIKPSTAITMAANDTIQFRLNQGADGVSMNIIIKS
jgi:hypothetical protein